MHAGETAGRMPCRDAGGCRRNKGMQRVAAHKNLIFWIIDA